MSISCNLRVTTPSGLHARPAAMFVTAAKQFTSTLTIESNGKSGNCKSLLSLLKLGVGQGASVEITADGPDEVQAVDALVAILSMEHAGDPS